MSETKFIYLGETKTPSKETVQNYFFEGVRTEEEAKAFFNCKIVDYSNTKGNNCFLWESKVGLHEGKRGYFLSLGNLTVDKKGNPQTEEKKQPKKEVKTKTQKETATTQKRGRGRPKKAK